MTSSRCIAKISWGKRALEGCFWSSCFFLWAAGLSWVIVLPPHIGRFDVEPPNYWEWCFLCFSTAWYRFSYFLLIVSIYFLEGFWMHESGYFEQSSIVCLVVWPISEKKMCGLCVLRLIFHPVLCVFLSLSCLLTLILLPDREDRGFPLSDKGRVRVLWEEWFSSAINSVNNPALCMCVRQSMVGGRFSSL